MLADTIMAFDDVDIVAICDIYEDRCNQVAEKIKAKRGYEPTKYADYTKILQDERVHAVLVASPWDEHIHMAIACMKAGKITAMEVGGAYDVEECWELVRAYEETKTPIMFMENCCFDRFELLSAALVRAGKFGEIVHCHGAYSHDLRDEVLGGNVNKHYRLNNYIKRNCENYPTHELGPIAKILGINRGNKMLSLVSVASKAAGLSAYAQTEKCPDPTLKDVKFAQGDIVNTIITCAGGETITLKLDTTLPRGFYSREFTVRGTKGMCMQEHDLVVIEGEQELHQGLDAYRCNVDTYIDYVPNMWKNITDEERELGHGGMDYLMFKAFFKAIKNGEEMPVDVYDGAAWMCITAISEQSVAQGGAPQTIPDFTRGKWVNRPRADICDLG